MGRVKVRVTKPCFLNTFYSKTIEFGQSSHFLWTSKEYMSILVLAGNILTFHPNRIKFVRRNDRVVPLAFSKKITHFCSKAGIIWRGDD